MENEENNSNTTRYKLFLHGKQTICILFSFVQFVAIFNKFYAVSQLLSGKTRAVWVWFGKFRITILLVYEIVISFQSSLLLKLIFNL